jgi:hypothetical protein
MEPGLGRMGPGRIGPNGAQDPFGPIGPFGLTGSIQLGTHVGPGDPLGPVSLLSPATTLPLSFRQRPNSFLQATSLGRTCT